MNPAHNSILARFTDVLNTRGLAAAIQAVAPMGGRPRGVHPAVAAVADHYGITLEQLIRGGRARVYSWPRQVAMFVLHEMLFSYPAIVRELNLANHTTALYAVDRVLNRTELLADAHMILARVRGDAEGREA